MKIWDIIDDHYRTISVEVQQGISQLKAFMQKEKQTKQITQLMQVEQRLEMQFNIGILQVPAGHKISTHQRTKNEPITLT